MPAEELQVFNPPRRRGFHVRAWAPSLIIFVATMAGIAFSPIILGWIYTGSDDYSALGDVGQAYGAASALVAGMALTVVLVSVSVQHRQLKALQSQAHAEALEKLVQLAMENPAYRQCWGARVAPDGIGENLFYYCSSVIKTWTTAWELGRID